jgi:hypothetical protein
MTEQDDQQAQQGYLLLADAAALALDDPAVQRTG